MSAEAERARLDVSPVAPLGVLDVLVIVILLGIILSAMVTELPRFERHGKADAAAATK